MADDYQEHFVDQHRDELIYRIGNVEAVLSQLLQENLLISEQYEAVRTRETKQDRLIRLFCYIQDWSRSKKDRFYQTLKTTEPAVLSTMERTLDQGLSVQVMKYLYHYKASVKRQFELMKDRNSRMGESTPLRRRFTPLLLLRKFRGEEERMRELTSSGAQQVQIMMDRSSEEYSPTSNEELFSPDENGAVPKTVVLHGPTGIGKSITAHKILLDWASIGLFRDKFHFLFYISYRDVEKITNKISLAGLLSKSSRLLYPPEVMKQILSSRDKLGFVINGFDEFKWTSKDQSRVCKDPFKETHKEVLLRSLIKGQLLEGATLIVTSRPFALEKLQALLPEPPRFVEIVGYSGEARERYIRVYFGARASERAVEVTKKNEALYTLCAVPFMCWVVSTVTKQMIHKYPAGFPTDTSMFLYYLKGLLKYHSRNEGAASCLRNVCALANEGVLNQKVLFEEADLKRHRLSVSSVESVFLNNHIFHGDIGKRTRYGFIHHSFQQLLAALHYALPSSDKSSASGTGTVREGAYLPELCRGRSLAELLEKHSHLALPARFLFGLLNQEQNRDFTKSADCAIAFQATTAMVTWLFGGEISEFNAERMLFLYETRDDDLMQHVVSRAADLTFSQCQKPDNWRYQLAFCLKACTGRKVTLYGYLLNREDLTVLAPVLKKCKEVCFRSCRIADDVNSPAGWKNSMFTTLVSQDSKIEDLCLLGCTLPSLTCEVLDKASKQSRNLSTLHVMFKADTKEEREEMRRYWETFKSPASTMSTKKMMGKTWFLLHYKQEKMAFHDMGHHMRWEMFDPDDFPFDYRSRILFSRRHL